MNGISVCLFNCYVGDKLFIFLILKDGMKEKYKRFMILVLGIIALTFTIWTFLFRHDETLLRIISSVCLALVGLWILLSER